LGKFGKRAYWFVLFAVLVFDVVVFVVAWPFQVFWLDVIVSVVMALEFLTYVVFIRRFRKDKVRYPLVPPEGKGDVYFPRTKIPRPIYEDMRRAREQRRKFAKLDKLRRKKKQ
jgi:hypothetical protein